MTALWGPATKVCKGARLPHNFAVIVPQQDHWNVVQDKPLLNVITNSLDK